MKLYSKRQLVFYSVISSLLTVSLAGIFFLIAMPGGANRHTPGAAYQDEKTSSSHDEYYNNDATPVLYDSLSASETDDLLSESEHENIDVYRRLNHAVVNITTIIYSYNWFLEPVPQEGGSGSGSIIDQEGRVLTNYHVVEDADSLSITLADGSEYTGTVLGVDPENDLAVLKFDPGGKKLTTIPFGESDNLAVGQKVLAIGNPFGLQRTMTEGIISALGRPLKTDSGLIIKETIQTDASINPGNSGGPLLNSHGKMIGVNTMIVSPSGGSVGIGFAVPVDTARRVIPDLITYGKVKRGWIEIVPVQLFPTLVRYAGYKIDHGILVSQTIKGGNAEKAGIKGGTTPVRYGRSIIYLGGDIIVDIDGMSVKDLTDLYSALEDNKPGESVPVTVLRGASYKSFSIILSERPKKYSW
ncbi:MAG: trypsin-like peptidase domain-containing protein [Spirochaetales bacterium]|nr:trypsin-like peptidase domain-containing protein [Spirochaetales bacterium]